MKAFWIALERLLARMRPHRQVFALAVDAAVIALAWNATYLFRLGFERWTSARPDYDGWVLLALVGLYLVVFVAFGIPRCIWRFSGFGDIQRLLLACVVAGVLGAAAVMGLGLSKVPRAVLALHPFISLMGLTLVRIGYRMLYEHLRSRIVGDGGEIRRALVLGAGGAARRLIAGIQHDGWLVVGLLDDDPGKQGARIAGVPVLGPMSAVAAQAGRLGVTHLVIAMPAATPTQRRRAVDLVLPTKLPVLTVPSARELQEGMRQQLRDMQPEDLLGRAPVQLDEAGIGEVLAGCTVLVTGAGGSIGSELCRQIARYQPARLVLYELGEYNLYRIEQELGESFPDLELVRLIGDVRDEAQLRASFMQWRPEVVFHAAAYKHVPLMEQDNAWAALRNNTLGTWLAARAAAECGAKRFVLISTDKAVNPTNVMGATKRAAEMAIVVLAGRHPGTRFIAVRFGNVLGSSGSVIPKFKEQIERGGPVTVTHPDIIRYFMTITEASRLVLQAAAIGESGQVLVLDMGEPVRIVDLAREMIRLAGHGPDEIAIDFTGLRPGEKLYEELLADADATLPTTVPSIHLARLGGGNEPVLALLDWAAATALAGDAEVQCRLAATIPEYRDPAGMTPGSTVSQSTAR
ncbi:MAG: nucleoside-diphosphate sugar epimerase/dehydratase [Piscinibacter sp.]